MHAGVKPGDLVALPPNWFDASDLGRPGLTREKDRVTGENRVVGYIVQLLPGNGGNTFLVAFTGSSEPVQQERTSVELEQFLVGPADHARLEALYFSVEGETNAAELSPRRDASHGQHPKPRASAALSALPQDAAEQPLIAPGPQAARSRMHKTSGAPPMAPTTLAATDLEAFKVQWHNKVKEFTMLGYGDGGEIRDPDGPIELHSSPWCSSAEVVTDFVVAAMTTYVFCALPLRATALWRVSSTALQVRRRPRRAAEPIHSDLAQKARREI
jgi:hypothetical protein